jgi:hypothetical protein
VVGVKCMSELFPITGNNARSISHEREQADER